jgi:TolB protein
MRKIILSFIVLLIFNTVSNAKVFTFTIENPQYKPIKIGLWGFSNASKDKTIDNLLNTIKKDIDISGLFSLDESQHFSYEAPETVVRGLAKIDQLDYVVYGNAFIKGDNAYISVKMMDISKGRVFVDKTFFASRSSFEWIGNIIIDELMRYVTGRYGPFESKIVFSKGKGKIRDIYACDFNGNNLIRLTNWHTMNILPKWIDKKTISFLSYRYGKPSIFLLNLYTGKSQRLFYDSDLSISAVRYDEDKFAIPFNKDGVVNIFVVSKKGRILRNLTNSYGINVSPTFTNDYSKMVFVSNRTSNPQLYVKNLDSIVSTTQRLTHDGKYNSSPAISPDNKKIAYISINEGKTYLRVMNIDGTEDKPLIAGYNLDSPSWSYDSRYIAVIGEFDGIKGIYIVNTLNNHYSIATGGNNLYNGLSVGAKIGKE